jgi:4-hydroxybenzoate polyprenyltransferase
MALPDATLNFFQKHPRFGFLSPYIELARLDRPIGWWLLLIPCLWSAALVAGAQGLPYPNGVDCMLFFGGAVVMRGAGCTLNDILDRDLDAQVERTKNRPLAAKRISVTSAVVFLLAQACLGLLIVLQFNSFTIWVAISALVLVVLYPLMKRIMAFPQAILGLTFAWGALLGWTAQKAAFDPPMLALYFGAVFWIIGYDTLYALQDINDDKKAGIYSSARLFGERVREAIGCFYLASVVCLIVAFWSAKVTFVAYTFLWLFALHLGKQLKGIDLSAPDMTQRALVLFRSNRNAGLILFFGLVFDTAFRFYVIPIFMRT